MSESGPIPPDSLVEVTGVQGAAVVVRTAVEPAAESADGGSPALGEVGGVVPKASPGAEKPALSPTLEDFDFDALEPPAA
jgi:hypothetical protein